ncbi:MAG: peptidylprolyl isomerase [Pirellulales bacterium]|nr:peptidylprolyl isomerase [Pirellulales bacterium]
MKPRRLRSKSLGRPLHADRSPRTRSRRACFEQLETRRVLSAPTLAAIADVELLGGSPLHIPLDGFDLDGDALTFTATSDNPDVVPTITEGNRSMRISVLSDDGAINGDMVFELFEDRVPRVTGRIIELAESGFYDGIIFHRVLDDFMIQTGDPLGDGTGGSDLPDFDDQFHVDLQHNTKGLLSMAKSSDDTNNSQFFITEVPTRHLDYNHSIFGQLVEGEAIREAISEVAVHLRPNSNPPEYSVPDVDIVMTSAEIFVDNENGVLMLKAPEGYTSTTDVTITVKVSDGQNEDEVTFTVTVTPDSAPGVDPSQDPHNADPFLADVADIRVAAGATLPVTFQLTAIDVEGDQGVFIDDDLLEYYGLPIPLYSDTSLEYSVDFESGLGTITSVGDLVGIHPITVGTAIYGDAIDYQVVPVFIVPDTAPTAELDMTLVRDLTELGEYGEIDALPEDQWIDEWDSFAIEVWATVTEDGQYGVHTVSTDLNFDNDLFVATDIEYGPAFTEERTGQIDNANGVIAGLGGETGAFTVNGIANAYPYSPVDPNNVGLYGDQTPILVARVYFEPNIEGPGVPNNALDGYLTPQTELGFAFDNAQVLWSNVDATDLTTSTLRNGELWPVMYDLNDNGKIKLGDLSLFVAAYGHNVGDAGIDYTWASDFNHNGKVKLGDLSYFVSAYGRDATSPGRLNYPDNFPEDWRMPAGAALMGTAFGSETGDSSGDASASDGASDHWRDIAIEQSASASRPTDGTARRKLEPVDLIMRFYDPRT